MHVIRLQRMQSGRVAWAFGEMTDMPSAEHANAPFLPHWSLSHTQSTSLMSFNGGGTWLLGTLQTGWTLQ
jgi:hypothetical protein